MDTIDLRQQLNSLFDEFFKTMRIDPKTGRVTGTNFRFSGMPYIGRNYAISPVKILYIALDIGEDECVESDSYHSFQDRADIFPDGSLNFNPHIAGMYASALYILKDIMGWGESWEKLWSLRNEHKTAKAICKCREHLPQDLMSYIAYENRYRFVTVGRKNKRQGDEDRKYLNPECERKMLLEEILVLKPDYIVFQGITGIDNCSLEELKKDHKVIVTYHPSYWQKGADKLQYIVEKFSSD